MLKGTIVRWMGVFARDELPSEHGLLQAQMQSGNRHLALVFNNKPANEHGQHWLAIYGVTAASRGGASAAAAQNSGGSGHHINIEFFDSYALPPAAYSLHSNFKSISHFS